MKMKQTMAEELSAKLDILNSNKFGKFVAQKCYLQVFKRGKEDWRSVLDKEEKVGGRRNGRPPVPVPEATGRQEYFVK